ncbi:hypothetical protein MSIMFI_03905 [Mycobacterium simulans]|uniref:restriction endonuclease subunit S n=1 Tax=Mycobacterium simulans TaxID=627089 RepID=UPI00174C6B32|nr:restriction endonuclease subunit S [Mycobacterium simulans]SON62380.1 hypothetical protein MSIMFI_03905 [Mycobacterium simulans]
MKTDSLILGESLELLIDNRGKNPPFSPAGVPVVSGMSVRAGRLDLTAANTASIDTWKEWMPRPTEPNDVVLTSEAPLGRVALVRTDEPIVIGQRVFCMRGLAGKLDSRYLYYAFQTDHVQADLASRATGTTVLGIRQPELRKVRIPAPSFEEQRAIAEVLGVIDDKIVANERVVEAAVALMFATVNSVTAFAPLSILASQSTTSRYPEQFGDSVAHFSLPAFDAGAVPEIVHGKTIKSNKFALSEPCVLFSKLNPRIPRIWNVCELPMEMPLASTEFVVLTSVAVDASLLWAALSQPEISEELRQKVAGTSGSHQRIRPHDLLGIQVRDVRELSPDLTGLVAGLGQVCHERRKESRVLARTRDELLPLLMSGRVRVKDAEAAVSEVL